MFNGVYLNKFPPTPRKRKAIPKTTPIISNKKGATIDRTSPQSNNVWGAWDKDEEINDGEEKPLQIIVGDIHVGQVDKIVLKREIDHDSEESINTKVHAVNGTIIKRA